MEILPDQSHAGPNEYRFVRISVDPIRRTFCRVTFLGSEDGTNWEQIAYYALSPSAKRPPRNGRLPEQRPDDGPR